ncbi:MAG: sulfatase [Verrucomicrobia bacterium]|nr:sulfatase [Verrucomicrobiota bacterium]
MRSTLLCLLMMLGIVFCNPAPAAEAKRPNILFVIFDDWNGSTHAGAYGCTWVKTPNFDRVAREGVLFKHAFTSNPKCSPCRASILTGRNTWQLNEAVSHGGYFPAGFETYPDLLETNGYVVGLTGKGWGPGDFKTLAQRTRNPAGPGFDKRTQEVIARGISPNDYPGNFGDFLQQRDKSKPFCFWMGFHEPHRPYEWNSGARLGKKLADVVVPKFLPDTEIVRRDLLDYSVEVEWGDTQIGRALKLLEDAGVLDDTLVVVTSDHGMPFPFVKGQIHEDAFHLPLAMRWGKGIKPGRVVEDFVNVRDLAPTYMELAGLKPHAQMTGKSLAKILRSDKSGWLENRDVMLAGKERHDIGRPNDLGYPVRCLRTKDFLYVHNFHPERWPVGNPETDFGNCDPGPSKEVVKLLGGHFYELCFGKRPADELYDIKKDPECVNNLASELFYLPTVEELRYKLASLLKDEGDPRMEGKGDLLEAYQYVGGRNKGYETWLKEQESTTLTNLMKKLDEGGGGKKAKKKKAKADE